MSPHCNIFPLFLLLSTPCSLDDLGAFTLGLPADLRDLVSDTTRVILPYCVSSAKRCLVFVQHSTGADPFAAPYLCVGQRLSKLEKVVALPWASAAAEAETLPEAAPYALGPVVILYSMGCCGSTILTKAIGDLGLGFGVSKPDVLGD